MKDRGNICGVPESKWDNGICRVCGDNRYCEMTEDVIVEQRAYQYAEKHSLLDMGALNTTAARGKLEKICRKKKVPKYFRDAVSCDGLTFSSLAEFPYGQMYRVCHDSLDGSFLVGDLVWRSEPKPGKLDGINFVQEAACLDEELCNEALKGAMFEVSYMDLPSK